jgi:hypothetical protein
VRRPSILLHRHASLPILLEASGQHVADR